MSLKSNQVVFFGSGPVAAKSLELLCNWCDVECVITKNKPLHHKDPAPVEELAKKKNLKLAYADNKSDLNNLINSLDLNSNVGIVIDYGVIIGQETIDSFKKGIINSHFSLLPEWRGADPISYSLLSGQHKTGVSIMLIDAGLDTGDLLVTNELAITKDHDSLNLTDDLIALSDSLLKTILPQYLNGQILPRKQDLNKPITYSTKLKKQDAYLNPNRPAAHLAREVKAFVGWPKSKIIINSLPIVIVKAEPTIGNQYPVGKLVANDNKLYFGCKLGTLKITELKPAGKNTMTAAAFINGYSHLLN